MEVRYRGPWSLSGGEPPVWPAGNGKRIYACLSPFPGSPKILDALRRTGCPTIVFGAFDPQLRDRFAAAHIHFEPRRLDLQAVAAQCDLAVLAGGQATTLAVLLAGKPVHLLCTRRCDSPPHATNQHAVEQGLAGQARTGCGQQ